MNSKVSIREVPYLRFGGREEGAFLSKPNLRELGHLAGEEIGGKAEQEEAA
jgi:hypothetical protein